MKNAKLLLLVALFAFLFTKPAYAADVVINEIMYDLDGSDDNREWIEIYNNSSSSIDLTNWRFQEGGTKHNLSSYQGGMSLAAGGYAVIVDNPAGFLGDHPDFSGIIIDSSFSLSNTGETLTLLESIDAVTPSDEVAYLSSWGGAGIGGSLERKSVAGDSNNSGNWQESISGGTPGSTNSSGATPTPTPTPSPSPTAASTLTPTSTPSPTKTPTPVPTKSPTPKPTQTPLPADEPVEKTPTNIVLGVQNTPSPSPTPAGEITQTKSWFMLQRILPIVLIFGGLVLVLGALISFVRQSKIAYNNGDENSNQERSGDSGAGL